MSVVSIMASISPDCKIESAMVVAVGPTVKPFSYICVIVHLRHLR